MNRVDQRRRNRASDRDPGAPAAEAGTPHPSAPAGNTSDSVHTSDPCAPASDDSGSARDASSHSRDSSADLTGAPTFTRASAHTLSSPHPNAAYSDCGGFNRTSGRNPHSPCLSAPSPSSAPGATSPSSAAGTTPPRDLYSVT